MHIFKKKDLYRHIGEKCFLGVNIEVFLAPGKKKNFWTEMKIKYAWTSELPLRALHRQTLFRTFSQLILFDDSAMEKEDESQEL